MVIPLTDADQSPTARQTLQQWFAAYHLELARHLDRLLGDSDAADDLLQDTFLRALKGLDAANPPANPRAWLYRIASNLAIDHLRRRRRWGWLLRGLPGAQSGMEHEVLAAEAIRRTLAQLKPQDAEVLVLTHYAGYSPAEVAAATGDEIGAIRKRLSRARERFRERHDQENRHEL